MKHFRGISRMGAVYTLLLLCVSFFMISPFSFACHFQRKVARDSWLGLQDLNTLCGLQQAVHFFRVCFSRSHRSGTRPPPPGSENLTGLSPKPPFTRHWSQAGRLCEQNTLLGKIIPPRTIFAHCVPRGPTPMFVLLTGGVWCLLYGECRSSYPLTMLF